MLPLRLNVGFLGRDMIVEVATPREQNMGLPRSHDRQQKITSPPAGESRTPVPVSGTSVPMKFHMAESRPEHPQTQPRTHRDFGTG